MWWGPWRAKHVLTLILITCIITLHNGREKPSNGNDGKIASAAVRMGRVETRLLPARCYGNAAQDYAMEDDNDKRKPSASNPPTPTPNVPGQHGNHSEETPKALSKMFSVGRLAVPNR
jgi:hypothetical protein